MKYIAFVLFTITLILININGLAQTCSLTCPDNIVVKADKGKEGAIVNFPSTTSLGTGDCGTITYSRSSGSFFRIGSHSVIATTSFGQKCFFTITVADNEPPVLSAITLSSDKLMPTNNRMKKVAVYYTASDNAQDIITVLSVNSNDTQSANRDWEIINDHLVRLKTSRLADGTPRVYTITVTSSDLAGNKTTRTTSIAVSKNINPGYASNDAGSTGTSENY